MDKGRIVEQGNHQELMQKHGAYYQLHQRNFEEN
jgi:subfamily B ATP-binding cassette protein MsbA